MKNKRQTIASIRRGIKQLATPTRDGLDPQNVLVLLLTDIRRLTDFTLELDYPEAAEDAHRIYLQLKPIWENKSKPLH